MRPALIVSLLPFLAPSIARAQDVPAPVPPATAPAAQTGDAGSGTDIVVTGQRLDAARAHIQPSLGATSYEMTSATIQALPGGENQQFNQILLQLPGVVQDGFG
jgi:outer membrane receptor for ferrienterochelin and colicins